MADMVAVAGSRPWNAFIQALLLLSLSFPALSSAYRPGDIVRMSKMGQYHSSRTTWHDVIGKHCPIFAVNREVLIPIAKPIGYTGTDPYKILLLSSSVDLQAISLYLANSMVATQKGNDEDTMMFLFRRYSGGDLLGVTAQVIDLPHSYLNTHPEIRKQFWDSQHWPKHVLVRYTWKEQSEIDVSSGFYVLFGSALTFSFVLSIYVLQSSREKLARFVRETVVESSSSNAGEIGKVE